MTCNTEESKQQSLRLLHRLAQKIKDVLHRDILVDVSFGCSHCNSEYCYQSVRLFTSDSIVYRASLIFNILEEISLINTDHLVNVESSSDLIKIASELKESIMKNLKCIFIPEKVLLSIPCTTCKSTQFTQVVHISNNQKNNEIDDLASLFSQTSV